MTEPPLTLEEAHERIRELINTRGDRPFHSRAFDRYVNEIADAFSRGEAAATERLTKWQPIETAPKDGTDMLVCTDLGVVRVAFWDKARGGQWSLWPGREAALPSQWMPLPDPPIAQAAHARRTTPPVKE